MAGSSSTIGIVKIGIRTDTKGLKKGTKKAKGMLGSLGKFAGPAGVAIAGVTAAFAALGVAAKITSGIVKKALDRFDSLDKLGKFSDELGITVNQLRGMELGARLTGTKVEMLHKGFQRLTRRLGEAQLGYGSGIAGLKALGLEADNLAHLGTFEAMKKVAQAIKELPGPMQKAAAASSLFGQKQGAELLTFLEAGEEGIQGFVDKMKKLGGGFSRQDIALVEQANDAWEEIRTSLSSVIDQIAIQLAPVVLAIGKQFEKVGESGIDMGEMVSEAFGWIVEATAIAVDAVSIWVFAFKAAQNSIVGRMADITQATAVAAKAMEILINLTTGIPINVSDDIAVMGESLRDSANELDKELSDKVSGFLDETYGQRMKRALADMRKEVEKFRNQLTDAEHAANAAAKAQAEVNKPALALWVKLTEQVRFFGMEANKVAVIKLMEEGVSGDIIKSLVQTNNQLELLKIKQEVLDRTKSPFIELRDTVQRYTIALRTGAITLDQYREAMASVKEELVDTFDPHGLDAFANKMEELRQQFRAGFFGKEEFKLRALDALPDRIKQATEDAQTPLEKYKDTIAGITRDMQVFSRQDFSQQAIEHLRDNALKELSDATKKDDEKAKAKLVFSSSSELGSSSAAAAIARQFNQGGGTIQEKQLTEQQKTNRLITAQTNVMLNRANQGRPENSGLPGRGAMQSNELGRNRFPNGVNKRLEDTAIQQLVAANEQIVVLRQIAANQPEVL